MFCPESGPWRWGPFGESALQVQTVGSHYLGPEERGSWIGVGSRRTKGHFPIGGGERTGRPVSCGTSRWGREPRCLALSQVKGHRQVLPKSGGGEEFLQEAVPRRGGKDFSDGPGSQERGAQVEFAQLGCLALGLFYSP